MSNFIIRTQVELRSFSHAMATAMTGAMDRIRREDGQDLVEYGGLLILVAAIITALFAAGVVSDIGSYVTPAVKTIFTSKPS